jgi:hypothetical protein
VSEIERRGGQVERPGGPRWGTVAVYGLAAVGVFSIVRFVMGTLFSIGRLSVLVAVIVLVAIGARFFFKGPPDPGG